jgi:hypothetical protein
MSILRSAFQGLVRTILAYRLALSIGMATAASIMLHAIWPWPDANALLHLFSMERPGIYLGVAHAYDVFLFTTPFLACSVFFSLVYVHAYRRETETPIGSLPVSEDPAARRELAFVVGEIHRQLRPEPSPVPRWLEIPERGLYTGIAVVGSIGSGKTQGVILPAMRQLFAYRADDPERRLSGIVLEVKGDLCRQLRKILEHCGRGDDFVEVSLDGPVRYNPLNNTLDAYAQAFNIASVITSIWGKGKEPFWQQSRRTSEKLRHRGSGSTVLLRNSRASARKTTDFGIARTGIPVGTSLQSGEFQITLIQLHVTAFRFPCLKESSRKAYTHCAAVTLNTWKY